LISETVFFVILVNYKEFGLILPK